MTITVKVHVNGLYKTTVKHVAGGVDREVREVGPNEEVSFSFHSNMGDNVFIVAPDVYIGDNTPAPTDVQEAEKNVSTREAMDAKENATQAEAAKKRKPASRATGTTEGA